MTRQEEQEAIRLKRVQRLFELIQEGKQDDFVHCHGHDYHSVRDAISKPKELMKKAKAYGMKAIAVTNHGNANGWVEEAEAAKDAGIKHIPGIEIYETEDRLIHSRNEMAAKGYDTYHLVLLAITKEGYYNLIKIISEAGTNGKFDGYQRIDMAYIRRHNLGRGIRCLSACLGGKVAQYVEKGDIDGAVKALKEYREIFDEAYIEIQDSRIPDQEKFNFIAVHDLAPASGCPLILTRDYHYIEKDHGDVHDTYISYAWGKPKDSCISKYPSKDAYYLGTPQEAWDYIRDKDYPAEAIYNTIELAEACEAKVILGESFFPKFPKLPQGYTERSWLRKRAHDGLLDYFDWCTKHGIVVDVSHYLEQLSYELAVISSKGYDGYFLIIQDVIEWCWKNKIITGPGRGSAAGSLLSFCLKITRLDPIRRGLLFERFLNPFRESWPDIDFDIPRRFRHLVMQYVLDTYGEDHVCQIINYGTMGLKSGIRDIIKALTDPNDPDCEYSEALAKEIAATVPDKMPDQGDVNLKRMKSLAQEPQKYIDEWGEHKAKRVINQAQEFMGYMTKYPYLYKHLEILEGSITQTGMHAAGVIICPQPIKDVIPIEISKSDKAVLPVAGWDSEYTEKAGFMKMDFLGLATLDIHDITMDFVEAETGVRPDMYDIGREDPAVFKTICDGHTHGVFQVSGDGLTSYLKQANPRDMDGWCDVIALNKMGAVKVGYMRERP